MNAGLAPRKPGCFVCVKVAHPEDVTARMFADDGTPLPLKDAISYIRALGHSGVTGRTLINHRKHVEKFMERGGAVAPLQRVGPQPKEMSNPSWVRAPDRAIDLGLSAMESLQTQLDDMTPAELTQLARLGVTASSKMGDWHAKGRQMGQTDRMIDLLFDISRPDDA